MEITLLDYFASRAPEPPKVVYDGLINELEDGKDMTILERHLAAKTKWAYLYAQWMMNERKNYIKD
jgi:predicted transcriptional regulator